MARLTAGDPPSPERRRGARRACGAVMPAIAAGPDSRLTNRPAAGCCASMSAASCRWLLLATLCMTLYAAATAAQAWIMEPMLDRVFLERDRQMLLLVPLAVVALALLKACAGYGQTAAMARSRPAHRRRSAAPPVRPPGPRRSRLRGRARPGAADLRPDLRHAAAARRRVVEPDHRRPRPPDRPVPDRADVLARLAARHARPDRPAARDLADQPGRAPRTRAVAAREPGRDGQASRPAPSRSSAASARSRPTIAKPTSRARTAAVIDAAVRPAIPRHPDRRHQLAGDGGDRRLRGRRW